MSTSINAQVKSKTYNDTLSAFQKKYIATHEVVKGKDRNYFRFFRIDNRYRVTCSFEKTVDSVGFAIKTSAGTEQQYFKYGKLSFSIRDTLLQLFVYQSKDLMKTKEYRSYLFVPFTDATTRDETYGGGRYLDLSVAEIVNGKLVLDFNKAYNPYCAYAKGFHCPIPPKENDLPLAIRAGEKSFGKAHG